MSGVTDEGFEAETVDTLKTSIEDDLKTALGSSFNVRPTSVAGILIGIFAKKLADVWEMAEAVYGSQYPETAFGASLDQVASLTGTQRLPASRSLATCGITGSSGTVIPTGSRIKNSATNTYWRLVESEGNVTVPIAGYTTGSFESEDFGEVLGAAGDLDTIDTVISGWSAVNNDADAALGSEEETDAALRLRRASLLQVQGAGTLDAIRSSVLEVSGVLEVKMLENVTLATDGNGLPAKSFEVLVNENGATVSQIYQAIWDTKPAGISAYGTVAGTATDSQGDAQYVAYTPAATVGIYVALTATTAAGFGVTATGVQKIKDALTTFGATLNMGDDVSAQLARAYAQVVAGVYDVSSFKIDIYSSPTATANLAIGVRSLAKFDTSRVTVALA